MSPGLRARRSAIEGVITPVIALRRALSRRPWQDLGRDLWIWLSLRAACKEASRFAFARGKAVVHFRDEGPSSGRSETSDPWTAGRSEHDVDSQSVRLGPLALRSGDAVAADRRTPIAVA